MFRTTSIIEQMQNELQWWEEQLLLSTNEGDLQHSLECKKNIESLISDIRSEMNK
jgi:hypothetical protein